VCEILAVKWPEPRPFSAIAGWARAMEYYGSGRFGWGVAWLDKDHVARHRDPGSMGADEAVGGTLASVTSTEFLVHFRRPTLLSTIQIADTQPFLTDRQDLAFCHNGLFTEAEAYRAEYAGRLSGAADSEVGFCMLQDVIESGTPTCDALAIVHSKLGGNANLATLGSDGVLTLFSKHERNQFWTFRIGDAEIAATELHSPDGSLFNLIFTGAADRAVVDESTVL
jgi:predicted glutamine amidotransferase